MPPSHEQSVLPGLSYHPGLRGWLAVRAVRDHSCAGRLLVPHLARFPAVVSALTDLGAGMAVSRAMTSSMGTPGASTAIGRGGGGAPSAGPWATQRSASLAALTPWAHRGQAGHGPPVSPPPLVLYVTLGVCQAGLTHSEHMPTASSGGISASRALFYRSASWASAPPGRSLEGRLRRG
jgi:hypothetical protein